MEKPRVVCPENEGLAIYMWNKRQEISEGPKGLSDNLDITFHKAYSNVCNSKGPLRTLKDFSQIKGVGKWMLRLMQGYFDMDSSACEDQELTKVKKNKRIEKRYLPQKSSVAYALLITLYRETVNGSDFMQKQELIDAAEASGLSRVPIVPEKGKGKPRHFGSTPREWYSGWSCMKTLIAKGLVAKSSCPAKYMLTEEGKVAARDCLLRSGLVGSDDNLAETEGSRDVNQLKGPQTESAHHDSLQEITFHSLGSNRPSRHFDVPSECLDGVFKTSVSKDSSSLEPSGLLQDDQNYGFPLNSHYTSKEDCIALSAVYKCGDGPVDADANEKSQMNVALDGSFDISRSSIFTYSSQCSFAPRACSSMDDLVDKCAANSLETKFNVSRKPPLRFGELFEDVYRVVLILDDREQFATRGSRSRNIVENICAQFKIQIEVRRLPIGDGIWIARHKYHGSEYVLDFIVERKKIDDLRCSIRDNRYKDQKLRLLRCGLKKMIYMVEGDPNTSEAAESIKTACFTTEILEGFDVQRTNGLGDTLKKYGYLTLSINHFYGSLAEQKSLGVCPLFNDFIRRCQDLDKMTISDVFAIQLMQVPQVTEEAAMAVLDMYPTLHSLVCAYSNLDGDLTDKEQLLKRQSGSVISGVASRNIFHLIWGS